MTEWERRLLDLERNPPASPYVAPEVEAWLNSLSVHALSWLARQHRLIEQAHGRVASVAEQQALGAQAEQLSRMDRAGLLQGNWWSSDAP